MKYDLAHTNGCVHKPLVKLLMENIKYTLCHISQIAFLEKLIQEVIKSYTTDTWEPPLQYDSYELSYAC